MVANFYTGDNKSSQVFRILLSILSDFSTTAMGIYSIHSSISNFSSPRYKPSGDSSKPVLQLVLPSFFTTFLVLWQGPNNCFSFRFFDSTLWCIRTAKSTIQQVVFLKIIIRSGILVSIWWYVCIKKFQRTLCVSFSSTDSSLYRYYLVVWWKFICYDLSLLLLLLLLIYISNFPWPSG